MRKLLFFVFLFSSLAGAQTTQIYQGGTGATTAPQALLNLGASGWLTGSGAPAATCSLTVNNGNFYTSASLVLYQCSNVTGSYVWSVVSSSGGGGGGSIVNAPQYSDAYYSSVGSNSVVSGASFNGIVQQSTSAAPSAANAHYMSIPIDCVATSANTTAYNCVTTVTPYTAPQQGDSIILIADVQNTGASTLSVNGGTSYPMMMNGNSVAFTGGELKPNQLIHMNFDATDLVWQTDGQVGTTVTNGGGGGGGFAACNAAGYLVLSNGASTFACSNMLVNSTTNTLSVPYVVQFTHNYGSDGPPWDFEITGFVKIDRNLHAQTVLTNGNNTYMATNFTLSAGAATADATHCYVPNGTFQITHNYYTGATGAAQSFNITASCATGTNGALTLTFGNTAAGVPLIFALNGKVDTQASTTSTAGFNLPQGSAPTSPSNGDMWTTASGVYAYINGATVGPFGTGGSGSFAAITSGTNTSAAMTVGNGASIAPSGTGTIKATTLQLAGPLPANSTTAASNWTIAFAGDSTCAGYGLTGYTSPGYPNAAPATAYSTVLGTYAPFSSSNILNTCVSGYTLANMSSLYSTALHPASPAVSGGKGVLFITMYGNDIYNIATTGGGACASSCTYANLAAYETAFSTYLSTVAGDSWVIGYIASFPQSTRQQYDQLRVQFDDWMRNNSSVAYYVNPIGMMNTPTNTLYYQADGIHPNAQGSLYIANLLWGALLNNGSTPSYGDFTFEHASEPSVINVDCGVCAAQKIRNVDSTGYSVTQYYDNTNTLQTQIGYNNASSYSYVGSQGSAQFQVAGTNNMSTNSSGVPNFPNGFTGAGTVLVNALMNGANSNQLFGTTATSITSTSLATTGIAFKPVVYGNPLVYTGVCHVVWEQTTAVSTVQFGINLTVNTATHMSVSSVTYAGSTPLTYGSGTTDLTALGTYNATGTITPTATATIYVTDITVTFNENLGGSVVTLYGATGNASDALLIEPGTVCRWL